AQRLARMLQFREHLRVQSGVALYQRIAAFPQHPLFVFEMADRFEQKPVRQPLDVLRIPAYGDGMVQFMRQRDQMPVCNVDFRDTETRMKKVSIPVRHVASFDVPDIDRGPARADGFCLNSGRHARPRTGYGAGQGRRSNLKGNGK
ncbi:MAG: hypothetical protein JJE42_05085, partial [Burkholderiales bacterium]|nr:hypothetical protein [Burkholderiales bacterium]